MQLRTILHPTDFSPHSEYAFQLACSLARDHGAKLIILHVAPQPTPHLGDCGPTATHLAIEEKLLEALQQIRPPDPAIQAQHWFEEGNAATRIVTVARVAGCDLIVMGTHGRSGLARLFMGSVAEKVLREASCPVLTVKTPFPAEGASSGPLSEELVGALKTPPA